MSNRLRVAACALLLTASSFAGTIIRVPANQPTIQAGINAASNGDTVLVAPGTYYENINFNGKAITVKSSSGASVTVIDGGQNGAVVTFANSETNASILQGFTVQNGNYVGGIGEGGGISIEGASPTVRNNRIVNNKACQGNGIGVGFGSPIIMANVISNNSNAGCGGIGGAGIGLRGASSAKIIGNTISNNSADSYGGGIALWSANAVLIENNIITGNIAGYDGGGISMYNDTSSVVVAQNLIKGNRAPTGNGIYWSNSPYVVVNNTIIDSPLSSGGSTVWADDFAYLLKIENNIVVATGGAINAFTCNYVNFPASAFAFNEVWSTKGSAYSGMCTDQTGANGNISANPIFTANMF